MNLTKILEKALYFDVIFSALNAFVLFLIYLGYKIPNPIILFLFCLYVFYVLSGVIAINNLNNTEDL